MVLDWYYIKNPQFSEMAGQQNPTIISFEKLDLFRFNMLALAWNLDFMQLKQGKLSADLTQIICDDCQLGYAKMSAAVKQDGISPAGVWTFAFVNEVKVYWRNYIVHPSSIIIYAPGSEINTVSAANFEVLTFSVAESLLSNLAIEMKEENFLEALLSIDLMNIQKESWSSLRSVLHQKITSQARNPKNEIDKEFIHSFTKKLLGLLKQSAISADKVSSMNRLKLIQTAEQYMVQNIGEPISVVDIARQCQVSERTLLYTFKERFDVGPKAFMNILKLNNAYHRLHIATDISSIASLARASGFWHMGQFYKDYKKFFGELPSQTLKNSQFEVKPTD